VIPGPVQGSTTVPHTVYMHTVLYFRRDVSIAPAYQNIVYAATGTFPHLPDPNGSMMLSNIYFSRFIHALYHPSSFILHPSTHSTTPYGNVKRYKYQVQLCFLSCIISACILECINERRNKLLIPKHTNSEVHSTILRVHGTRTTRHNPTLQMPCVSCMSMTLHRRR
jgi:hypothetical protein